MGVHSEMMMHLKLADGELVRSPAFPVDGTTLYGPILDTETYRLDNGRLMRLNGLNIYRNDFFSVRETYEFWNV